MMDIIIRDPRIVKIIVISMVDRPMLVCACCDAGVGCGDDDCGGKTGDQKAVGVGGIVAYSGEYEADTEVDVKGVDVKDVGIEE
jgi:hypothetical protein